MTLILPHKNENDNDTEGHRRVFVTNWWSPGHLFPHGATIKWRAFKTPEEVTKYMDGKRIDLFLMEDEVLVTRVFQWQAFSIGQMPDPQTTTQELIRDTFRDMAMNLIKSATDAHTREVERPRELKIGHPFLYLQIFMPYIDPRTALAGQSAPIKCLWWEVTPTEIGAKTPVIQAS